MCPELQEEVLQLRDRVNERLAELVPPEEAPPQQLHRAIRYSLVAPGKRVRPLMTLLTAPRLGAEADRGAYPVSAVTGQGLPELLRAVVRALDDAPPAPEVPDHSTGSGPREGRQPD